MVSKSVRKHRKSFSLVEVMITVAILSTAIVFVFRAFTTVLSSTRFSQNITVACLLVEDKLWEAHQKQKEISEPLSPDQGRLKLQGRDFNWNYKTTKLDNSPLIKLELSVSWKENMREKDYQMDFLTYILPKK